MAYYYETTNKIESLRPRHWADTAIFKVWPESPDLVVKHDKILFKWTVEKIRTSHIRERNNVRGAYAIKLTKKFSLDDGLTWREDNHTKRYEREAVRSSSDRKLVELLEEAIQISKKERARQRARERARNRRAELKREADKKGITIQELKARKKKARKSQATKKDVELLNRKIQVGPVLKELQDEIN